LEAIEEICDPEGELDALEGVESLLEKSLLRQEEGPRGEPRFVMLETVHEYAREKLQESREAEEIKRAHAQYFLALAEEAEPELKGPEQLKWLEYLEAEHDNMRAALSWSQERGETELALQLGGALWWFWFVRGHLSEGRRWLEEVLAKDGEAPAPARAKALSGTGRLTLEQGDTERAKELLEESVRSLREVEHNKEGLAEAVDNLGIAWAYQGDLEEAKALFEESLRLYREAGDRWGIGETLNNLGAIIQPSRGEMDRARALYEESQKIRRELGDKRGITMSLGNLAGLAALQGDLERTEVMLEEVLRLGRELKDKQFVAQPLGDLGYIALERGELERAGALLRESLLMSQEMGEARGIISGLDELARLAAAGGARERAARLWGAVEGLIEATGLSLPTLRDPEEHSERYRAACRAELGEAAWEVAYGEGRAMTLEEAVSYALEEQAGG
jgi:tetratricopeptide (TPR) repeat protein